MELINNHLTFIMVKTEVAVIYICMYLLGVNQVGVIPFNVIPIRIVFATATAVLNLHQIYICFYIGVFRIIVHSVYDTVMEFFWRRIGMHKDQDAYQA